MVAIVKGGLECAVARPVRARHIPSTQADYITLAVILVQVKTTEDRWMLFLE